MNVKERILTIRLMEKVGMYPGYAEKLGLTKACRKLFVNQKGEKL